MLRAVSTFVARNANPSQDNHMTTKYRVQAVRVAEVAKFVDQQFNTFKAAANTRDFLKSKGYVAVVQIQVSEGSAS